MKKKALASLVWVLAADVMAESSPTTAMDLYVDPQTQQLFAQPGPGRERLGRFARIDDKPQGVVVPGPQPTPSPANGRMPATTADVATPQPVRERAWYERLGLRGYMQLRYNHKLNDSASLLRAPGDRFIGDRQNLGIRRARLVISGDLNDRVSLYLQPDLASTPTGSSTSNFAQLRDAYADIYLDTRKEWRVRAGQSKVPYGWENLQSSQNRIAPDRADALNAGVRDERDLGLFLYYTPRVAADRFKYLVQSGLKGSGDYGIVGLGVYNGQGANRSEQNNNMHTVLHLTYPFRFDNGQFLEVGADAYTGRFKVTSLSSITADGQSFTPRDSTGARGALDQRVAAHVIYYPQPFGFQAEWTVGRGPELDLANRTIRQRSLRGGYVQAMYKIDGAGGSLVPYVKWQTYRGASKFDTNAPRFLLNEVEAGVEWQVSKALEIAIAYANMRRTHLANAPYRRVQGDLLRMQLQVNY
ncbi:porin [Dyella sp.]|uniref:porin n=1 Tax=Dyella sp. TaxID=1869338 RepID=UPI002ED2F10E